MFKYAQEHFPCVPKSIYKPSSPKVKVCSLQSESLFLGAYTYNQWYSQTYKGCWDRYLQTYKRCKIEKYANHICHSWCVLLCFYSVLFRFPMRFTVFQYVLWCFTVCLVCFDVCCCVLMFVYCGATVCYCVLLYFAVSYCVFYQISLCL